MNAAVELLPDSGALHCYKLESAFDADKGVAGNPNVSCTVPS